MCDMKLLHKILSKGQKCIKNTFINLISLLKSKNKSVNHTLGILLSGNLKKSLKTSRYSINV